MGKRTVLGVRWSDIEEEDGCKEEQGLSEKICREGNGWISETVEMRKSRGYG